MKNLIPRLLLTRNHPINRSRRLVQALQKPGISLDGTQRQLVDHLAGLPLTGTKGSQPSGIYIFGPPGRGKSMILDAYFTSLDPETSARYHFHDFFHSIHQASSAAQGGPQGSIFMHGLATRLAGISTLCFDEFHCVEPGDAMFMARLLGYCQDHGITLITTSNYEPEKLLDDPYFHHLIEPTIAKIRSNYRVFELDNRLDYRTIDTPRVARSGYRRGNMFVGGTPPVPGSETSDLKVGYDTLSGVFIDGGQLHISYDLLCRTRRNTRDYLELSERFSHWIVPGIPDSKRMPMDEQRRFANLLDVLYDRDIQVDLYCVDDLSGLGEDLAPTESERLISRLAQLTRPITNRT